MLRRLALVAVLALTACTAQPDPPTPSPTPTVVPLSVAQGTKAALTVADLPKGWDDGVAPDPIPTLRLPITYTPAECRLLRDPLRDRATPATSIRGQYFHRAADQNVDKDATEVIASWPTPQLSLLRQIAAALPRCKTYAGVLDGESYRLFARELPVPGLRDGIALRFGDPNDPTLKSGTYSGYVVRGGTVLALRADSDTFTTDAAFIRFLTTAVARLDAAIG
ncbi:hypothetical protein [Kribbella sp. NPDC004536]|uniref:hypothetical protein n=1 Tax=Kribbella sp. NPDC004536 TaxID=3364106 RepID=UPI003691935D